MIPCELCHKDKRVPHTSLCGPCLEMIGRVMQAQANLEYEAVMNAMKALKGKAGGQR